MASEAQRKRELLAALRVFRRAQRALDSALEKVEREIFRLRARKTLIQGDDVLKLIALWDQGVRPAYSSAERSGADFVAMAGI